MYEDLIDRFIYTPGPVKMSPSVLKLGAVQTPYFRNAAFSKILLDCESMLLALANAPQESRVVFLTAAGTAAMEATVINLFGPEQAVGVVNGGSFGQRFVDICRTHCIPTQEVVVDRDPLTDGHALAKLDAVSGVLVNAHETSVGHLYDLGATAAYCQYHHALHVVDAISLFVSDPLDMQANHIDALVISSHKGLALPPGLAMVLLAPSAIAKIRPSGSYYLDFASHLRDGERGQTPFTPAISIILQLHRRLLDLSAMGFAAQWQLTASVAAHFRNSLDGLPLRFYACHMPNAMTALELTNDMSASWVVAQLEKQYRCVVAPNGGALREKVFRVSHMGMTDIQDMDRLVVALRSLLGDQQ